MSVIEALAPAFAVGFAVQQLLEIVDPILDRIIPKDSKKAILGLVSLTIGLVLAYGAKVRVLQPLGVQSAFWDPIVTGIVVSAGTQGLNSILKWLGYAKENKKAEAKTKRKSASLKEPTTTQAAVDTPPTAAAPGALGVEEVASIERV